jgi:hypothetical protein
MTLILTEASIRYVLQASDRLLTQGRREFDPVSNKTVVYLCRDALVSIAYSGPAYLDETPTDQWITERLTDERFDLSQPGFLKIGPLKRSLDIGQSIELLRAELGSAILRLPPSVNRPTLHVIVAGWQWGKRQARPVATHIVNQAATPSTFYLEKLPRYWHFEQTPENRSLRKVYFAIVPTSNPLSHGEQRRAFEQLLHTSSSPNDSTQVLIDTIRLAASKKPRLVGEDCMCVYLPPPSSRVAEVVFVPPQEQRLAVVGRHREELPAAFSPWVVGHGLIAAPSMVVGSSTITLGPFTIKVKAPVVPSDAGITGVWSSQRRPLDPRRRQSP